MRICKLFFTKILSPLLCIFVINGYSATKTFTGPGNFSDNTKWSGSTLPVAGDLLQINGSCTFDNAANNLAYGNLNIGFSVAGTLTYPVGATNTLNVVNVSSTTAASNLTMTNGGTLIIRGTWSSTNCTFTYGTGTIEIQSSLTLPAAYTNYYNLKINGAGITVNSGVGTTINNNLDISAGTFTSNSFTNIVTGTATVTGTYTSSTTGTKTYGNLTVNGGTFNATNRAVTINGNLINNGTFTMGTGRVTFGGATSNTVTGTAATTAFGGGITVNKGVSQANVIDVQCVITILAGGLTLTNGTFELSSASTIVPFTSDPNIPTTAKLWCNGGTMNQTSSFDWSVDGYLKVSAGSVNFGSAISDRIIPTTIATANTGVVEVSGGALNATGRISNGTNAWTYIQSGGVTTLGTIGNNVAGRDVFNMDNTTGCVFSMSGGTLVIQNSGGTAGENLGYHNTATLGTGFTGGTLQMGNASTNAGTTMRVETSIPIYNLTVNSSNVIVLMITPATPTVTSETITNDLTITSGVLDVNTGTMNLSVGGDWTNTSTAADPFLQGAQTVTFNGTAAQTIDNTGDADGTVFNNVVFNNTYGTIPQISIAANVTVQSTLTMTSGKVNFNATTFTLGTSAASAGTLSYTSGWFYGTGTLARYIGTAILAIGNARGHFPMGSATDYHPLWFGFTATLTAGGLFTVSHTPSGSGSVAITPYTDATFTPPAAGATIVGISNAKWTVDRGSINLSGTNGILRYGGTGFNVFISGDLNASNATGTVGTYGAPTNVTGTYFEVNRTLLANGHVTAKDWYVGTTDMVNSPLPIELVEFEAKVCDEKDVCVSWTTASEHDNAYFTVEHSKDGVNFSSVGIVNGAGNSSALLNYDYLDLHPFTGVSYYRLKQTDFNGDHGYSIVRAVDISSGSAFSMDLFPNPSDGGEFNISLSGVPGQEVLVVVYDIAGKENYSKVIIPGSQTGDIVYAIDPEKRLAPGVYLITATSQDKFVNKKLVVR
ncbi:MAG: T9SS type A sorting domain-containing protein [Bacteroidia bacterium]